MTPRRRWLTQRAQAPCPALPGCAPRRGALGRIAQLAQALEKLDLFASAP